MGSKIDMQSDEAEKAVRDIRRESYVRVRVPPLGIPKSFSEFNRQLNHCLTADSPVAHRGYSF